MHQRVVDVEERRRGQVGVAVPEGSTWRPVPDSPLRSDLGAGFPGVLLRAVRVVVADLALSGSGHGHNIRLPLDGDTDGVDRQVELAHARRMPDATGRAGRRTGFRARSDRCGCRRRAGESARRAEFGDRLPVVLLDRAETATGRSTRPRLRADLAASPTPPELHSTRKTSAWIQAEDVAWNAIPAEDRANLVAQLVTDYRGRVVMEP